LQNLKDSLIFGFVLIGMAVYFLEPLFPSTTVYLYVLALLAVIAGIYLGWLDRNKGGRFFTVTRNVLGAALILFGIFLALPSESAAEQQIAWQGYSPEILSQARAADMQVIIDFFADWCIPCKELDKFTFTDRRVLEYSSQMIMIKADLTHFQTDETRQLREKFDIKGVPTIVFLDRSGQEIPVLRLVGYEDADKFIERMQQVLN